MEKAPITKQPPVLCRAGVPGRHRSARCPFLQCRNQPWFVPSPSWAQQGPWVSPGCGVHAAGAQALHLSIGKPGFVQPQKLGGLEESMQLGTLGGRIY